MKIGRKSENNADAAGQMQNRDETESGSKEQGLKKKKRWSQKKKIIVFGCIGLVLAALIGVVIYGYIIWSNPLGQFANAAQQAATAPPEISETPEPSPTATDEEYIPIPTPDEPDPYEVLVGQADMSVLKDIVNIMLIGVDYAEERETWSGKKAFHADVMIVLSINTKTKDVHMISLPRDTYAKIPGVKGIYKLNASIDCGGGWPKESGFKKVCEAATWMLGGIPVQYYYAVDMGAVKGLVDAIGGVDFNIDFAFTIQKRSYKKGMQHLNGQGVLDYMRVRKHIGEESGDLNRIDRQKNMLVAIFNKLKQTDLLLKLPEILGAFEGNLYTNVDIAKTAGFAAFMYKEVDASKIKMHSMDGKYAYGIFNWNFVITDQQKRVKLIKEIYGVKVPAYGDYDYASASALWESMQANVIASKSKAVLDKVKKKLEADNKLPPKPTASPSPEVSYDPATSPGASDGSNGGQAGSSAEGPYQKYTQEDRALYERAYRQYKSLKSIKSTSALRKANTQLKKDIEKLCTIFNISKPSWRVNYEKNSNEIYVNFN